MRKASSCWVGSRASTTAASRSATTQKRMFAMQTRAPQNFEARSTRTSRAMGSMPRRLSQTRLRKLARFCRILQSDQSTRRARDHDGDLVHRVQRGLRVGARSRCARCRRPAVARERVRERPWRVFCRPAFRDLATVGHNIGDRGRSSPVGRRYPASFGHQSLTPRFCDADSTRISSGRRLPPLARFKPFQVNGRFSNRAFGSSSFLVIFVGLIVHAGHASLHSLLAPSCLEPLHACMGSGSGEPRFWTRSERSSHNRLHPSRRPHGTIRPGSGSRAVLDHAAASDSNRNSVPSIHMRWSTTAILRATATMARRRPLVFISRTPHAFKLLQATTIYPAGLCRVTRFL